MSASLFFSHPLSYKRRHLLTFNVYSYHSPDLNAWPLSMSNKQKSKRTLKFLRKAQQILHNLTQVTFLPCMDSSMCTVLQPTRIIYCLQNINEVKCQSLSCVHLFATPWTPSGTPWTPSGKNTGLGCHSLLQAIYQYLAFNLGIYEFLLSFFLILFYF